MSELNLSYDEVFYKIPFHHLIFLTTSLNPDLKEQIKANNFVIEKQYSNRIAPAFNF